MNKNKWILILLLIPGFSFSAEIEMDEDPISFNGNDHLIFYSRNIDSSETAQNTLLHENDIQADYRNFRFFINYTNRFETTRGIGESRPFVIEKKQVGFIGDEYAVELGDTHQEFGRGLALSIYSDDVFGINTTLEGISSYYQPGPELALFGGRLNALSNPVAISPLENALEGRNFYLFGAGLKLSLGPSTELGFHHVVGLNSPDDKTGMGNGTFDKTWNRPGFHFSHEGLVEDVDLYAESTFSIQQTLRRGKYDYEALAASSFLSLSWTPSPWVVKLEAYDYRNDSFEWRRPPMLEIDIVETKNTEDITAGRLQVENHNLLSKQKIYGSYLLGSDRASEATLHHVVGGAKFKTKSQIGYEFRAGYRSLVGKESLIHGSAKFKVPTFKHQSVDLALLKKVATLGVDTGEFNRDENIVDLTYTFSKKWNAGVGYEYIPTNLDELGQHFVSATVRMTTGNLSAKAFVGKTSGGTKCSGGVCRQVPAFTGGVLETIYTF